MHNRSLLLMSALAVMVKTPGVSPVKTRLAHGVGVLRAGEFYHLCLDCITETMQRLQIEDDIFCYWAVAEESALKDAHWQQFPRVLQQGIGLGERIASVVRNLLPAHGVVILVGADSPQLNTSIVCKALALLADSHSGPDVVLGPSADGGFYLIAMRVELPLEIWNAVEYSQSDTLLQFVQHVHTKAPQFRVDAHSLPILCDLDEPQDLEPLAEALQKIRTPIAQKLYHEIQKELNHVTHI